MQYSETARRYILLGLVGVIVIGIITANIVAKKQDDEFLLQDALYQQAKQAYNEQNFEQAVQLTTELLKMKPKAESVNYLGGLSAANIGNYEQAAILLQKTLDINPHKVEDPMFMLQFGEVLFSAERLKDAKVVLLRCQEWAWAPEEYPTYQERVAELLAEIETT